jgi:hypothetical protein
MREALELVQANPEGISAYEIAALVYNLPVHPDGMIYQSELTAAQVASVRRALVKLVRAGQVADLGRGSFHYSSRRRYATPEKAAEEARLVRKAFGWVSGPSDPIKPRPSSKPKIPRQAC